MTGFPTLIQKPWFPVTFKDSVYGYGHMLGTYRGTYYCYEAFFRTIFGALIIKLKNLEHTAKQITRSKLVKSLMNTCHALSQCSLSLTLQSRHFQ